ncbi:acyl-CoA dehydrogenase family protein [Actinocorallia aurantiaca]|uniref:Acyl-CoA dehydrogenase family protein n=1 Tax=Actinocorallia aurantiaca TaxID=46204 RepID=A0ABN3U9T6_9ACTN
MSDSVLDKVMEQAEQIRELGPVNESLGKLDDKAAKVLRDSGVMRMLQPVTHGGLEVHPREFAETVMGVASLDGSTGWVAGIVGLHPWEMAFADERVQQEIWGENQDTWIASPYAPMGVARPVDGGYILNGRWQFSSGTDHCDWIFLGAMVGDSEGKVAQPPNALHVILPRSDYQIVEDSWNVVGLEGTGSKDIIVKDAFLPEYRTLKYTEVVDGTAVRRAGLTNPLYKVPYTSIFPLGITSAVVGIAEGALAAHLAYQRSRVQITGTKIKDDPYVLYAISEAAEEIKASRVLLLDYISRMYDQAAAGKEFTFAERAAARRTQVRSAWRAVHAMTEIVVRSGGNGLRKDNPIQRFWRDAHMGLAHAIHVPGSVYHVSALTQMDIEPPMGPMRSMI